MITVETINSKDTSEDKSKLSKILKVLSLNVDKNNELLGRLLELSSESESTQGLASVLSTSSPAQRKDKVGVMSDSMTYRLDID